MVFLAFGFEDDGGGDMHQRAGRDAEQFTDIVDAKTFAYPKTKWRGQTKK